MKKPTQKERVVSRLLKVGKITRNECLSNYISRLSAIILELTKEGWRFDTSNEHNDYVYTVTHSPYKVVSRTLSTGEKIITYEQN